jgi:hypothetical protein
MIEGGCDRPGQMHQIGYSIPVGTGAQYAGFSAGAAAPDGWLLCNGGTASRTVYARLFALVGTTYGAGDGTTTFTLPAYGATWMIKY